MPRARHPNGARQSGGLSALARRLKLCCAGACRGRDDVADPIECGPGIAEAPPAGRGANAELARAAAAATTTAEGGAAGGAGGAVSPPTSPGGRPRRLLAPRPLPPAEQHEAAASEKAAGLLTRQLRGAAASAAVAAAPPPVQPQQELRDWASVGSSSGSSGGSGSSSFTPTSGISPSGSRSGSSSIFFTAAGTAPWTTNEAAFGGGSWSWPGALQLRGPAQPAALTGRGGSAARAAQRPSGDAAADVSPFAAAQQQQQDGDGEWDVLPVLSPLRIPHSRRETQEQGGDWGHQQWHCDQGSQPQLQQGGEGEIPTPPSAARASVVGGSTSLINSFLSDDGWPLTDPGSFSGSLAQDAQAAGEPPAGAPGAGGAGGGRPAAPLHCVEDLEAPTPRLGGRLAGRGGGGGGGGGGAGALQRAVAAAGAPSPQQHAFAVSGFWAPAGSPPPAAAAAAESQAVRQRVGRELAPASPPQAAGETGASGPAVAEDSGGAGALSGTLFSRSGWATLAAAKQRQPAREGGGDGARAADQHGGRAGGLEVG